MSVDRAITKLKVFGKDQKVIKLSDHAAISWEDGIYKNNRITFNEVTAYIEEGDSIEIKKFDSLYTARGINYFTGVEELKADSAGKLSRANACQLDKESLHMVNKASIEAGLLGEYIMLYKDYLFTVQNSKILIMKGYTFREENRRILDGVEWEYNGTLYVFTGANNHNEMLRKTEDRSSGVAVISGDYIRSTIHRNEVYIGKFYDVSMGYSTEGIGIQDLNKLVIYDFDLKLQDVLNMKNIEYTATKSFKWMENIINKQLNISTETEDCSLKVV